MGFLSKSFNKRSVYGSDCTTLSDLSFLNMLGINTTNSNTNSSINSAYKLNEITYFTCLKTLSDKVGSCKIDIYQKTPQGKQKIQHYLDYILNVQPNPLQNASIFWSTMEYNKNEYGNGYVFIDTNKGKVNNLWILPSQNVQVWIDDTGIFGKGTNAIWYLYTDPQSGQITKLQSTQVLHFKNWCTYQGQGLKGLSVKDILSSYITQAQNSNDFVNGLVQNGFVSDKIILQSTGSLDTAAKKKLIAEMQNFSSEPGNKWIPLPIGLEAKPISSSLVDSQYMDLTKYNALQIASAFGISPSFINNYDKGNYANVESQQDSLYRDCLFPLFNQYGQEETIKLLTTQEKQQNIYMEYNMDSMLQGNFNDRMTGYATAVNSGILARNEVRLKEGWLEKDGGDELTVNGTMINITDVGAQYNVNTDVPKDNNTN